MIVGLICHCVPVPEMKASLRLARKKFFGPVKN